MAFKYYPEYQAPQIQQGEITNYAWVPVGMSTYNNKPDAVAAAHSSGFYGTYDMRIIKSSWEVVESLPKV